MSETKVLHEFLGREFNGELSTPCRVIERDGEIVGQVMIEGEWSDAPCEFATEVARLTRELSEARDAIRSAPLPVDVCGVPMVRGGQEWINLPAVRAAVEEGK